MSETKRKIILKKIKRGSLDTIWHPESTLVFKSQKERLVIGRIVDDEFQSLDEDAIALCVEWKFKPDETLIEPEQDEGEEEGEEDESGGEDGPTEEDGGEDGPTEEDGSEEESEVEEGQTLPPKEVSKEVSKEVEVTKEVTKEVTSDNGIIFAGLSADKMVLKFSDEITKLVSSMQNEINQLKESNSNLTSRLEEKTSEYEELEQKYNVINTKFSTMKSLFN